MTTRATLPDLTRDDAGVVLASELSVQDPAHQRSAADAMLDVFDRVAWPEGLLSHTVMLGTDGTSLFHYAQWRSEQAYEAFVRDDPPERLAYIRDAVPDLKREASGRYELYRSLPGSSNAPAGFLNVIVIDFEADGPERPRLWVDELIEAVKADGWPEPGVIGAHFHVSLEGERVINVALWENEASLEHAMEKPADRTQWQTVLDFPGMQGFSMKRFTPYRSRQAPQPDDESAVRALIDQANALQSNIDGFTSLLTEDATVVNIAGVRVSGRDSFRAAMSHAMNSALSDVRTYTDVLDVRFPTPEVGIVSAVKYVQDGRADGAGDLPSAGNVSFVVLKQNGTWRIALAQTTPLVGSTP